MSDYRSKLQNPLWQKRRLEIMELANWKCSNCLTQTKELHVHHMLYRRGKEPWEYEDCELMCLCESCHKHYTETKAALDEAFVLYVSAFPSYKHAIDKLLGYMDAVSENPRMENPSYNAGYLAGRIAALAQFNDAHVSNLLMIRKWTVGDVKEAKDAHC